MILKIFYPMKKLSKVLLPVGIISTSILNPCFADESKGIYFKGSAGITDIRDVTASALGVSIPVVVDSESVYEIGLGYDFGNDIRTEFVYDKTSGDISKVNGVASSANIDASTFSASIFKDFSNESKFTPYIGIGLGTTNVDIGTITISGTSFAGSNNNTETITLTAGTGYQFNETSNLFLEINNRKVSDLSVGGVEYTGITTLGFNAGIRFLF